MWVSSAASSTAAAPVPTIIWETDSAEPASAVITARRCANEKEVASPVVPSTFNPSHPECRRRSARLKNRPRSGSPRSETGVAIAAMTPRSRLFISLTARCNRQSTMLELDVVRQRNRRIVARQEFNSHENDSPVAHLSDPIDHLHP